MQQMTQIQKLEKLVAIAMKNGWKYWPGLPHNTPKQFAEAIVNTFSVSRLLFEDKSFTKAIFGKEMLWMGYIDDDETEKYLSAYKCHLQEAVIARDPIAYLYKTAFEKINEL